MAQPPLFHELDFTKENVLTWAEERVLDEPVISVLDKDEANTAESVLRMVLLDHYLREWSDLDKGELIHELFLQVVDGVDCPLGCMTALRLVDEIMEICKEAYEFETMDDFVRCFGSDD